MKLAPLAYMRGRTLNDAFIILDESQNTTIEQMKMFLTRIGFNGKRLSPATSHRSTCRVIWISRGLRHAIEVLADVEEISFNFFHSEDVVRHPVVARIVNAYEAWKKPNKNEKRRWRQNASAKNRNKNESGDPRFTTGM
ncbi:PhoH family protein [Escherichia coli]